MLTLQQRPLEVHPSARHSFLKKLDVFRTTMPSQLAEIENKMIEKNLPKGSVIYSEGDEVRNIRFLEQGLVKEVKIVSDREKVIGLVIPGDLFEANCDCLAQQHLYTTVTVTDSTILDVPKTDFAYWTDRHPMVFHGILNHISKQLRVSKQMMRLIGGRAEKRLLYATTYLSKQFGNVIPLTRSDFAEITDMTVETAIRTFKSLERRGFIQTGRGKITIASLPSLMEIVGEF